MRAPCHTCTVSTVQTRTVSVSAPHLLHNFFHIISWPSSHKFSGGASTDAGVALALLHQAKVPPSSYLRPAHCCCRPTGTSSQVLDPPHFPPLHHTTPCPHHSHFQSHSSIPEEYICIPLPSLHLSTASRQPHQLSPSTTLLSFQGIAKTLVNSFYNNSDSSSTLCF